MAKTIQFLNEIQENQVIKFQHIAQLVEAFSGADEYDITITGDLTAGSTAVTSLNVANNRATIDKNGIITAPKVVLKEFPQDPSTEPPTPEGQITYYRGSLYFSDGSGWFKVNATQVV